MYNVTPPKRGRCSTSAAVVKFRLGSRFIQKVNQAFDRVARRRSIARWRAMPPDYAKRYGFERAWSVAGAF
jgi:hypothetical protein